MPKPLAAEGFSLAIEYYREEDGRWLADIAALPGVTAYGRTKKQATAAVQALALRLIADRLEHGEAHQDSAHAGHTLAEMKLTWMARSGSRGTAPQFLPQTVAELLRITKCRPAAGRAARPVVASCCASGSKYGNLYVYSED
jgi:predicted RNase H-like HicB family nuclease